MVVRQWIRRIISSVLIILLISVTAMVISTKLTEGQPELFGYQLKSVLSGSMEPGIQTGSLIAVESAEEGEKSNFQIGDVIMFVNEEENLVTHRIVEVTSADNGVVYTTKGDNNDAPDAAPVFAENVVGVYTGFTIPYAGYFVNFAQSPNGNILFMIVPGFLIMGYSMFLLWRILRQLEEKSKNIEERTE